MNNGVVSLDDDVDLVLSGGSFTNSAGGTLRITVNPSAADPGAQVSHLGGTGTMFLGGALDVVTIGSPILGWTYTPISVTSRIGTFSTLTSAGAAYQATYSSTSVGLVATPRRGRFVPISPTRILDTRTGIGGAQGRVAAGGVVDLPVSSLSGPGPTALALTVTTTEASPATSRSGPRR